MKNELTVDDNGEWCGAFAQDQYLVSDEVIADLESGAKTWNIERDYKKGVQWEKVFLDMTSLEDTFASVIDLINIQAVENPSVKESGKLLGLIDDLTVQDLCKHLEALEEDIAAVMLEALYKKIAGQ